MQVGADEIVEKGVHLRHSEGSWGQFLSVDFRGLALFIRVRFLKQQAGFDQQPARTAGGVVDGSVGFGVNDVRHKPPNLFRRVELARALSLTFGKFPQQIFVSAP